MATDRHIIRTETDGVLTLTLDRGEKLNAFTHEMLDEVRRATVDLAERRDLRVMVIGATGPYFTSGVDISTMRGIDTSSGIGLRRHSRSMHLVHDELEAVEKPVVLAAQGHCLGLGVELACSCDFRLAAAGATFALPEIPAIAVSPSSGGISRLTRLVGPHWARWLAMAAKPVDAETARIMGLVHEVHPDDELAGAVDAFARHLVSLPPEAMAIAKLTIDASVSADRTSARDIDRIASTLLTGSSEHRERVEAFLSTSRPRGER